MEYYPKTIYYPRESVEDKFKAGQLSVLKERLDDFVLRHQAEIIVIANDIPGETNAALLDATKQIILRMGAIHPPSEMAEQIKEIQNETWYRGEQGQADSQNIKENWSEKYSIQWREARNYEAFFLLDEMKDHYLGILRS